MGVIGKRGEGEGKKDVREHGRMIARPICSISEQQQTNRCCKAGKLSRVKGVLVSRRRASTSSDRAKICNCTGHHSDHRAPSGLKAAWPLRVQKNIACSQEE